MANNNVQNFPVVDNRVVEFAAKLEDFVYEHGKDLSIPSILGALEIMKHVILTDAME